MNLFVLFLFCFTFSKYFLHHYTHRHQKDRYVVDLKDEVAPDKKILSGWVEPSLKDKLTISIYKDVFCEQSNDIVDERYDESPYYPNNQNYEETGKVCFGLNTCYHLEEDEQFETTIVPDYPDFAEEGTVQSFAFVPLGADDGGRDPFVLILYYLDDTCNDDDDVPSAFDYYENVEYGRCSSRITLYGNNHTYANRDLEDDTPNYEFTQKVRFFVDCARTDMFSFSENFPKFIKNNPNFFLGSLIVFPFIVLFVITFLIFFGSQWGIALIMIKSPERASSRFEGQQEKILESFIGRGTMKGDELDADGAKNLVFEEEVQTFNEKVNSMITGGIISLCMLGVLELKNIFAIWFAVVCFLRSDVDVNNPYYIVTGYTYNNFQNILAMVIVVYLIIEVILLLWWIKKHIVSPVKVILIYGTYQEWIWFRFLLSSVYIFYLYVGLFAFYNTNAIAFKNYEYVWNTMDNEADGKFFLILLNPNFTKIILFYTKALTSVILLVLNILMILRYDGYSSINYYHKIIENEEKHFPFVKFGIPTFFKSPDANLCQLILTLSMIETVDDKSFREIDEDDDIQIRDDIMRLKESTDYGNLNWILIKDLGAKEIKFLKEHILSLGEVEFVQTKEEEEYNDLVLYTTPLKPDWWRAVFCFTCIRFGKQEDEVELTEEERLKEAELEQKKIKAGEALQSISKHRMEWRGFCKRNVLEEGGLQYLQIEKEFFEKHIEELKKIDKARKERQKKEREEEKKRLEEALRKAEEEKARLKALKTAGVKKETDVQLEEIKVEEKKVEEKKDDKVEVVVEEKEKAAEEPPKQEVVAEEKVAEAPAEEEKKEEE